VPRQSLGTRTSALPPYKDLPPMKRSLPLLLVLLVAVAVPSPAVSQKKIPAEEQKKLFKVPEGFEIELVAAEPTVINPITMTIDEKGRIYVSESHTYRYG